MTYRMVGSGDRYGSPHPDFDRGLEEADNPPAPVRTIAVTPEMQRADAEERARREAANGSDWKVKSSLSEDNLGRGRVQITPGRFHSVAVAEKDHKAARPKKVPKAPKEATKEPARPEPEDTREWFEQTFHPVVVPQPKPERIPMSTHADFTIQRPVPGSDLPDITPGQRVSKWQPIVLELRKLDRDEYLPIDFKGAKSANAALFALRKLTRASGRELDVRRDGLTAYLRILPRGEAKGK